MRETNLKYISCCQLKWKHFCVTNLDGSKYSDVLGVDPITESRVSHGLELHTDDRLLTLPSPRFYGIIKLGGTSELS